MLIVPATRDSSGSSRRASEPLRSAVTGLLAFIASWPGLACTGLGDGLEGLAEVAGNGASPATAFSALTTWSLMPRSARRARSALYWQHMTLPRRFEAGPAGQRWLKTCPSGMSFPGVLPPPLADQVGDAGNLRMCLSNTGSHDDRIAARALAP